MKQITLTLYPRSADLQTLNNVCIRMPLDGTESFNTAYHLASLMMRDYNDEYETETFDNRIGFFGLNLGINLDWKE